MPVKIVLVGMMGCGKSTVGNLLAKALNLPFIEIDAKIEQTYGKIPLLFEKGEGYFRALETEIIKSVCAADGVISTGGGVVTVKENIPLLKRNATVIYLDLDGETLFSRCQNTDRPLAKDKRLFLELLQNRDELYRSCADVVVDTRGRSAEQVTCEILKTLKK